MTYEDALAYLENYTWSKTRLGLGRTRELCRKMGNPHKDLKFIHVTGSNGKGSTCAMLASILEAAGYRTGLYTSPYVQTFCERIQINGENIPGHRLAEITEKLRDAAESMDDHPSWFEMVTAVAFQYYTEESCDIVVLEVGMGGEFDSTNVIDAPEVAVITNIALEHTEYLGATIEAITRTKCGIIKPGCDVVSYDNTAEAKEIISEIADKNEASLVFADPSKAALKSRDLSGQTFEWIEDSDPSSPPLASERKEYKLALHGDHQLKNVSVVMEVVAALRRRGWEIPGDAVYEGLANTLWPARFQILEKEPLFILDGGHNPQCAEAMTKCLSDLLPGQRADFMLGILEDKDFEQMIDILAPYAASFHCIAPDNKRAVPAGELVRKIKERGFDAIAYDKLNEAIIKVIQSAAESGRPAVCFGSLYLAGEVLNTFTEVYKKWLRKRKIEARDALTEVERMQYSSDISCKIAEIPEFKKAKTVMIYNWTRGEVRLDDLRDIALAQGKTVIYPVCDASGGLIAVEPGDDTVDTSIESSRDIGIAGADINWRMGSFGIQEPNPDKGKIIAPEKIDVVICPCTAFDDNCNRLGMGGGYYDRFLPACTNAKMITAAFEVQKAAQIPIEDHDIAVDVVITESRSYTMKKNGAENE